MREIPPELRRLAETDPNVQYNLGVLCYQGKEWEAARTWFMRAAKGGSVDAQRMLGLMLEKGEGGSPDQAQA